MTAKQRNAELVQAWLGGEQVPDLATRFAISENRVRALIRNAGYSPAENRVKQLAAAAAAAVAGTELEVAAAPAGDALVFADEVVEGVIVGDELEPTEPHQWITQTERDRVIDDADEVFAMIRGALAPNTHATYRSAIRRYWRWCIETKRTPVPATVESMLSYLRNMERHDLAISTVRIALAALRRLHSAGGPEQSVDWVGGDVHITDWVKSYAKKRARDPAKRPKKSAGARKEIMWLLLGGVPADAPYAIRDRAVILLAYFMAARRSELVNLHIGDVRITVDGMEVLVAYSKTDQEGAGTWVVIPPNPTRPEYDAQLAVMAWVDHLASIGIHDGPLFVHIDRYGHVSKSKTPMTGQAVEVIVKRALLRAWAQLEVEELRARQAGDQAELLRVKRLMSLIQPGKVLLTPHSMRRGFATDARAALWDTLDICRHGRWSPQSGVVHEYIEEADRSSRHRDKPVLL